MSKMMQEYRKSLRKMAKKQAQVERDALFAKLMEDARKVVDADEKVEEIGKAKDEKVEE